MPPIGLFLASIEGEQSLGCSLKSGGIVGKGLVGALYIAGTFSVDGFFFLATSGQEKQG